ncbi:Sodium/hydrogen exchanger 6 [Tetrabaena socialis]|uniref:Sodium/hydrogen exchanger 6 n=1 Tax=Tetrabaena socialis TaxID=47790 RepID=A0A2J8A6S8_9CHLO|nr:Sodium/hydrogen exchanger 6 [Tetrabaena socialis]|eukprot:PNH08205.1 Sodium/hydrogen exchanger 6 [Tetrabaena socialis]
MVCMIVRIVQIHGPRKSGPGSGPPRTTSWRQSPGALLNRMRSLNDGRLVDRFDDFDRRVSKMLIHPDALREAELAGGVGGSGGGGGGAHRGAASSSPASQLAQPAGHGGGIALCLIALAVSRAANILPCSALVNLLRPRERHIPPRAQLMMWWAGLRGAMAFALSVEASEKYGEYGKVMKTCTFYLIFITVLFNGGTAGALLQRLRLRAEDTPALILNRPDTLGHMHGFGSADVENGEDGEENGRGGGGGGGGGGGEGGEVSAGSGRCAAQCSTPSIGM